MTRTRRLALNRHVAAGAAVVVATIALMSCGSDDATSTPPSNSKVAPGGTAGGAQTAVTSSAGAGSTPTGGSCVASANAFLEDWKTPPSKLPDSITALSKAPEPGGSLIYLAIGPSVADVEVSDEMAVAMKKVG